MLSNVNTVGCKQCIMCNGSCCYDINYVNRMKFIGISYDRMNMTKNDDN